MHTFNQNFSWSSLRHSIFTHCPLAYYYHYYASWGGWESDADSETKQIYLLKNLRSMPSWVIEIFKTILLESKEKRKSDINILKRRAFATLHRGICDIRNKEYINNPKNINLIELYYKQATIQQITTQAEALLDRIFANFAESKISKTIEQIPYLKIKRFERPASFYSDGIQTWSTPDLVWEERGIIYILNIFISDPKTYSNWAIKNGIDAIFAETKWKGRKIETISLFPNLPPPLPFISITQNKNELKSIIRQSANNMLKLTNLDTDIQKENFANFANHNNCETCKFRELCH